MTPPSPIPTPKLYVSRQRLQVRTRADRSLFVLAHSLPPGNTELDAARVARRRPASANRPSAHGLRRVPLTSESGGPPQTASLPEVAPSETKRALQSRQKAK